MSSSIGLRWHERWRQRQVTAVSHWCRVACEETVISGKYGRSFTVIQTILTSMKCDAATNSCIDATMRICSNIMCHMPVALSHELFSELVHRNKLGKKYPLPCHLTAWVYLTTSRPPLTVSQQYVLGVTCALRPLSRKLSNVRFHRVFVRMF